MPAQVEKCVKSLMAKWKADPASRPTPKKEDQDAKSQAFAICQASYNKSVKNSLAVMLADGYGPALIGAAATNRPYIPQLEETRVEEIDGEKKFIVHLANPGFFDHPLGAFVLNNAVFSTMINNFESKVVGQKAAYDSRHQPQLGALGWFEKLWIKDGKFYGQVDPTKVGLEQIENRTFLYSSMEFHRNYKRDDVKLDLEDATDDFCTLDLEENYIEEIGDLGYQLQDEGDSGEDRAAAIEALLEKFLKSKYDVFRVGKYDGKAPPGTVVKGGYLYMHRDAAKAYLSAMKSVSAEMDWDEVYELFNPYHSKKDGRFTSKSGAGGVSSGGTQAAKKGEPPKKPKKWTGERITALIGAGLVGGMGGQVAGGFAGGAIGMFVGGKTSGDKWAGQNIGGDIGAQIGSVVGGWAGMMMAADKVAEKVDRDYAKQLKRWEDKTNAALSEVKSEDNMDELVQLEQQLEEEKDRAQKLQDERDAAVERALKLEKDAVDSMVKSVVELSKNHRDSEGRALPTSFTNWVAKFLRFEDIGKDNEVVKLEEENRPGSEFVRYAADSVRHLILSMPGTVPAERQTHSGSDDDGEEFDFNEMWED